MRDRQPQPTRTAQRRGTSEGRRRTAAEKRQAQSRRPQSNGDAPPPPASDEAAAPSPKRALESTGVGPIKALHTHAVQALKPGGVCSDTEQQALLLCRGCPAHSHCWDAPGTCQTFHRTGCSRRIYTFRTAPHQGFQHLRSCGRGRWCRRSARWHLARRKPNHLAKVLEPSAVSSARVEALDALPVDARAA